MTLWLIFAALTLATVACLLRPLLRRPVPASPRIDYDLAVYRDQLAEVDKDFARGLLDEADAAAARTEIQRRMLTAADAEMQDDGSKLVTRRSIIASVIIAVLLPLGALFIYSYLGSPELPGEPYAERAEHDPDFVRGAAAQQEAIKLLDHPTAAGYKSVGDTFLSLHRYSDAADAYRMAAKLDANDAATWSSLGESIALLNEGDVNADARDAFMHALALNPRDPKAEFSVGVAEAQGGDARKAVAIWRDLQQNSPADAPWIPMLTEHIKTYADKGGFDPKSIAPKAP